MRNEEDRDARIVAWGTTGLMILPVEEATQQGMERTANECSVEPVEFEVKMHG